MSIAIAVFLRFMALFLTAGALASHVRPMVKQDEIALAIICALSAGAWEIANQLTK